MNVADYRPAYVVTFRCAKCGEQKIKFDPSLTRQEVVFVASLTAGGSIPMDGGERDVPGRPCVTCGGKVSWKIAEVTP